MKIGKDVFIHEDAWIKHKEGSKIGNHVAIDKGVQFSTKVDIGDYVHIVPYVVTIGGKNILGVGLIVLLCQVLLLVKALYLVLIH